MSLLFKNGVRSLIPIQMHCFTSMFPLKTRQTVKFGLNNILFVTRHVYYSTEISKLLSLLYLGLHLRKCWSIFSPIVHILKQTFELWRQSKLKRREFTYNRCYQRLYTCTMYFQGRRNTRNMLRSLKQKQRKVWTSSQKIYQAKMFCWRSISKRDEIMSSYR